MKRLATKKSGPAKQVSTLFLKSVIYLIGLLVLGICIFALPIGLRSDAMGMYQPIIIALYIAAVPFFVALYQALKLLGYIDRSEAFSLKSVAAIETVKYCAIAISVIFASASPYIYWVADIDDAPGTLAVALIILFASIVIATIAAVLQKLFQNAVDIKLENDLTV